MTDIVERIRDVFEDSEEIAGFLYDDDAYEYKEAGVHMSGLYKAALEATDEIKRLREEIELLRKALGRIALVDSQGIALAALGQIGKTND